jgi:hypothetical protein
MNQEKRSSLSGCTQEQLRVLLNLVLEGAGDNRSLPSVASEPGEWRPQLNALCESEDQSGDMLLAMVCRSSASESTLNAIKEKAKRLEKKSKTKLERAASLILYQGAVAAAYAFHGRWISTRPRQKAIPIFGDLAQSLKDDPLAQVFRIAMERYEDSGDADVI